MTKLYWPTDRRAFLKGTVAAGAAAAMPLGSAFGAGFPERNMQIYVPTREGGGADRNQRAFTGVWKKYLKTEFEASFYPGAAGRVGYEKYMGLAKDDCHELIFGNMGPEVLNWVVKPPTFNLDDFMYIARVDADPGIISSNATGRCRPLRTLSPRARSARSMSASAASRIRQHWASSRWAVIPGPASTRSR